MIWEVLGDIFKGLVDRAVFILSDLLGVLIDKVWRDWLGFDEVMSRPHVCETGDVHTDDSLGGAGPRSPQAELAQVVLGLLRECV